MLNDEGWVLLLFLVLYIAMLLLGFRKLRPEITLSERLTINDGIFSRDTGVFLRLCGLASLAVVPGMLYSGGLLMATGIVSLLIGAAVLLFVILPKLSALPGLTPTDKLKLSPKMRIFLSAFSLVSTFVLTAGALSLSARFVAGVFSLHYVIALGGVTLSVLLLCLLKNAAGRAVSDRFAAFLPIAALLALCVCLYFFKHNKLSDFLNEHLIMSDISPLSILSCACMGLGLPGLLLPSLRFSASQCKKKKGVLAFSFFAILLLLAGALGSFGVLADDTLSDTVSSETILLQLSNWVVLPKPLRGVLSAILIFLPMLYAQDGLKAMGNCIVWDLVQPCKPILPERKLLNLTNAAVPILLFPAFLCALPATLPLKQYLTLALLLSVPLGMVFAAGSFGKTLPSKRLLIALLFGEGISVLCFVFSMFIADLGFLPALPAALVTLLPLWIGG